MQVKSDKSDKKSNIQEQGRTTLMKARFLETLGMDRVAGNVLVAANATGLSRDTVYRWRNEDSEFATKWQEVVIIAVDKKVDLAEDKLHELVMKGNITAIIHTLKRYRPEVWDKKSNDENGFVNPKESFHVMSPRFKAMVDKCISEGHLKRNAEGRLVPGDAYNSDSKPA